MQCLGCSFARRTFFHSGGNYFIEDFEVVVEESILIEGIVEGVAEDDLTELVR